MLDFKIGIMGLRGGSKIKDTYIVAQRLSRYCEPTSRGLCAKFSQNLLRFTIGHTYCIMLYKNCLEINY